VKILDFGLAKLASSSSGDGASALETAARLTSEGVVLGTVGYMSPEQAAGRVADFRSDQFSFGVVLYELLGGRRAFARATAAETLVAIMREEPPPLSDVSMPSALDWLLERCLAKDPEERFAATRDLARDLGAVQRYLSDVGNASSPRRASRAPWALTAAVAGLVVGAVLVLAVRRRVPAPAPPNIRFEVPPPNGGEFFSTVETQPIALSPDGTRLALVASAPTGGAPVLTAAAQAQRTRAVWIRELSKLEPHAVPGSEGASSVFWSPDGRNLAFFTPSKLKRVEVSSGGAPVTICDVPVAVGRAGTWGAGGDILFASVQGDSIFRVPASGGAPEKVLVADAASGEYRLVWPWYLPDGKRFLYMARSKQQPARMMLGGDGPPRVVLTATSAAEFAAPDHLVYARDGVLLSQRFDASKGRVSGEPVPIADRVAYFLSSGWAMFTVSQTGTVAFQSHRSSSRLAWFDRTGREMETIGPKGSYLEVSLSRDGRKAYYDRTEPGIGTYDAFTLDLARGIETRLSASPETEIAPIELADGRFVYGATRQGQPQLYVLDTATGREERLVPGEGTFQVPEDLSPDGRTLLYVERTSQIPFGLWSLPLSPPGKPTPLFTSTGFGCGSAHFSPDGRLVAFLSDESGRSEAYVTPFPGPGPRTRVSSEGATAVRWAHGAPQLFYLSADGRLMTVKASANPNLSLGAPEPLFAPAGRRWVDFDVNPDGSRFLAIVPEVVGPEQPLTVAIGLPD
jgi:Tol biopolymer transport system component